MATDRNVAAKKKKELTQDQGGCRTKLAVARRWTSRRAKVARKTPIDLQQWHDVRETS
jgi:hypothetical protein